MPDMHLYHAETPYGFAVVHAENPQQAKELALKSCNEFSRESQTDHAGDVIEITPFNGPAVVLYEGNKTTALHDPETNALVHWSDHSYYGGKR